MPTWGNVPTGNASDSIDPAAEAARKAAADRVANRAAELAAARFAQAANPTSSGAERVSSLESSLAKDRAASARVAKSGYTQDTERVGFDDAGELDVSTEDGPETNQTDSEPTEEEEAAEPTEDDEDGFYSDVNPTYILDKRVQVLRTPDKAKHMFFLETYKSIHTVMRGLQAEASTEEDREELQDITRLDPPSLTVIINRSGVFRSDEGNREKLEFEVPVYMPPNEGKLKEDYMVDSCLWCTTAFREQFAVQPEMFNTQLAPAAGDSTFTFPVLYVSRTAAGDTRLAPLSNLKYYNLFYDTENRIVDIVFWSNVRSSWLSDPTREYYNAYPFTRDRDLRNVGRVLLTASGWHDKVILRATTGEGDDEETAEFRQSVFIFGEPTVVQNPGLGGEFDVNRYEPVVDSLPWGFKFVEYTS